MNSNQIALIKECIENDIDTLGLDGQIGLDGKIDKRILKIKDLKYLTAYSDASDPLLPILTDPPIPEGLTPQN